MTKKIYVSNIITEEEIKKIEQQKKANIFINTPTATGKSTFVLQTLYNHCKANNKKMLLLVHRSSVFNQFKNLMLEYKHTDKNIIILKTYQSLEAYFIKHHIYKDLSQFDYIVCDEGHYFCSPDTTFNYNIDLSLETIMNTKATRLFMSATMGGLGVVLDSVYDVKITDEDTYTLPTDYSYINEFKFFKKNITIENIIDEKLSTTDEKIIVFCNKNDKLKKLIEKYQDVATVYVSKSNKYGLYDYVDEDEKSFVEQNGYFNKRLLLATSVLDCGFTFKDEKLTTMIIANVLDFGQVQQMVGRKRLIDDNDYLNLYIQEVGGKSFSGIIQQATNRINIVNDFNRLGYKGFIESSEYYKKEKKWLNILYNDTDEEGNKIIKPNMPLYYYSIAQKIQCEYMNYGKDHGYAKLIAMKLGQVKFKKSMLMNEEIINKGVCSELEKFLHDAYENDEIFTKEYFRETIDSIIEKDTRAKVELNRLDGGKGRPKGLKIYNKLFDKLGLNYAVISKKISLDGNRSNKWLVGKTKEEQE